MGIIYSVLCKQCREYQDLDKLDRDGHLSSPVRSRSEAQEVAKYVGAHPFRSALLVSFMFEHQGHDCILVNDASGEADERRGFKLHPSKAWSRDDAP